SEKTEKKDQQPLRYVGIRLRKRQGELFGDGTAVKHFAVVSNTWEGSARRLLEWHRQKAGTIEMVHDILKNDLAAGVLPCGRFGANAAWLRLAVLADRKSTRLNSSHVAISYAVFCLKKKSSNRSTPSTVIHASSMAGGTHPN